MSKAHLRVHAREVSEPQLQVRKHGCDASPKHDPCYLLLEDYVFIDAFTSDELVTLSIPRGFHHDGASIPKWIRSLIDSFDLSITAPFLHDVLYRYCGKLPSCWITPAQVYTRAQCDRLFRYVMDLDGVPEWREFAAYQGVRICGWKPWRANARNLQEINQ